MGVGTPTAHAAVLSNSTAVGPPHGYMGEDSLWDQPCGLARLVPAFQDAVDSKPTGLGRPGGHTREGYETRGRVWIGL